MKDKKRIKVVVIRGTFSGLASDCQAVVAVAPEYMGVEEILQYGVELQRLRVIPIDYTVEEAGKRGYQEIRGNVLLLVIPRICL